MTLARWAGIGLLGAALCAGFGSVSVATAPASPIAEVVGRVASYNPSPAVDSFAEFLVRLPAAEGAERGYRRDRTATPDLLAARAYIRSALADILGPERVTLQAFNAGGYLGANIIGIIPGATGGPHVVIGAHYDAEQNAGADDNASGVAALLEAARALQPHVFLHTLEFVAFDQEEEREGAWGNGSRTFALAAKQTRLDVRAMIGLDMVAYNAAGTNRVTLSRCDRAAGTPAALLSARVRTAMLDYSGLSVVQLTDEDASDPCQFHQAGVPALLVSEAFTNDGWPLNPYYHLPSDYSLDRLGRPQTFRGFPYIDVEYAARIIRGVVAWTAVEGGYVRPLEPLDRPFR